MATDIMDKDLKQLRNARWDKAFSEKHLSSITGDEDTNRKATIVIEHIIQASDVSHTMQHWHVYRKWNELLFREMYRAYQEGRAEKDVSMILISLLCISKSVFTDNLPLLGSGNSHPSSGTEVRRMWLPLKPSDRTIS